MSIAVDFRSGLTDRRHIDVAEYLTYVAKCMRENGWVSGKQAHEDPMKRSTRNAALDDMFPSPWHTEHDKPTKPTDADIALGEASMEWAAAIDLITVQEHMKDFWHNVKTVATNGYADWKAAGVTAAIVRMYQLHLERIEKDKNKDDLTTSQHFSEVGKRIVGEVRVIGRRTYEGAFGPSTMIRMITKDGNVVVTFTSGKFDAELGEVLTIAGTVKKNDIYQGIKQTIVSRPSKRAPGAKK